MVGDLQSENQASKVKLLGFGFLGCVTGLKKKFQKRGLQIGGNGNGTPN